MSKHTCVERGLLHGQIGAALEALYGKECQEMVAQLAWHFAQVGGCTPTRRRLITTYGHWPS